jgi:hypothetical protein
VPEEFYSLLHTELAKFPGSMPVLLDLQMPDSQALLKIRSLKVSPAPGLAEKIESISMGHAFVV